MSLSNGQDPNATAEELIEEEHRRRARLATLGGQVERGEEIAEQGGIDMATMRAAKARRRQAMANLRVQQLKNIGTGLLRHAAGMRDVATGQPLSRYEKKAGKWRKG